MDNNLSLHNPLLCPRCGVTRIGRISAKLTSKSAKKVVRNNCSNSGKYASMSVITCNLCNRIETFLFIFLVKEVLPGEKKKAKNEKKIQEANKRKRNDFISGKIRVGLLYTSKRKKDGDKSSLSSIEKAFDMLHES